MTQPSDSKRERAEAEDSEAGTGLWEPLRDECARSDCRYESGPDPVNQSGHCSRYDKEFPVNSALDRLEI